MTKLDQKEYSTQGSEYRQLLSKHSTDVDMGWCFQIKEVDRRISYFLVKKSSLICDVGGAKGVDSFVFAERGAFVVNVDINGFSLKIGKNRARETGLNSNLSFIKASATDLPFRNDVFDLITCFSTLDHLPNKKSANEAIMEFSRTTHREGHVAITVPNYLFLIGTISMKVKEITEPDAFFEQRFTPKELFCALSKYGLMPILIDSEFPRSVAPSILTFHFPKLFRKMPGMIELLSVGAKILEKLRKAESTKLFGARMGYLSVKT